MPIDRAVLCRYFIQLHDAFKSHADSIQKEIDKLIAELKTVLQGPYLTKFVDAWDKATTTEERIAAAEAAHARLTRLLQSGAPIDPWVGQAQELLAHLIKLLRVLAELRKLEAAMGAHVAAWCG